MKRYKGDNMKKIIFIILVLFCLTGCDNNVELEFNENIKAEIKFSFTLDEYKASVNEKNLSDNEAKSRIESMIEFRNAFTDPYSELFEEKTYMNNGKYYNGIYEYSYTYSNFNDNYVLNNCFDDFGVEEDKESIYILAKGNSKCAPFDLKVTADDRMISSNEDEKDGNEYIWNIKKTNNDIYMAISKTPISQDTIIQPKDKSFNFSIADLIYLFIALIIVILVVIIKKKNKESE